MSFWGSLGHILLKAAPIAALAIPGVGPLASMAIGGLASGAEKKLSGGSWTDALKAGGIGAGAGYVGGGGLSSIGPSSGALAKLTAGAGGKVAGTGWEGTLGQGLSQMGQNALMSNPGYASEDSNGVIPGMGGANGMGRMMPSGTTPIGQAVRGPDMSNSGLGPSSPMAMMSGIMQNLRAPNLQNALDYGASQVQRRR